MMWLHHLADLVLQGVGVPLPTTDRIKDLVEAAEGVGRLFESIFCSVDFPSPHRVSFRL